MFAEYNQLTRSSHITSIRSSDTQPSSSSLNFAPEQDVKFRILYEKWRTFYDIQFPTVPCSHCSILLLPRSVKWKDPDPFWSYRLQQVHAVPVTTKVWKGGIRVAVCSLCHKSPRDTVRLGPYAECLKTLPPRLRTYLSPLKLETSLGGT